MSVTETPSTTHQVEHVVENLLDIGATWARYGLTVGKSALETSAKTLGTTAEMLGDLAKRFEQPRGHSSKNVQ